MNRLLLCLMMLLTFYARGVSSDAMPELEPFVDLSTEKLPAEWLTDHASALIRARESARLVLLAFTGGEDSPRCERLEDEILRQKPFLDYASEKLVLVELDFPNVATQPTALKEQNQKLKEEYAVTGFPTVILVDADGRELGRTGYMQGGAKTFVRELKRLSAATPKVR